MNVGTGDGKTSYATQLPEHGGEISLDFAWRSRARLKTGHRRKISAQSGNIIQSMKQRTVNL